MLRFSRREFLQVAGLGVTGALLAACQPQVVEKEVTRVVEQEKIIKETVVVAGTPQVIEKLVTVEPAAEQVELSWARHGSETDLDEEDEIAALFKDKEPNITVKSMVLPWDDYNTKIPVMVAGGTAPDTLGAHPALLSELYTAKGVINVEDYIDAAAAEVNYDDVIYPGDAAWDGHIVGLPQKTCTHTFRYNADLFAEAGLATPQEIYEKQGADGWNWESFISMGKGLTKDLDGDSQFDQYGFAGFGSCLILSTIRSAGGDVFDDKVTKCILTEEKAKAAFKFMASLVQDYQIQPPPEIAAGELGITFNSGRIAIAGCTTCDSARDLRAGSELPFSWDYVVPPAGSAGFRVWGDTDQIVISTSSKHVEQAFKWMVYRSSLDAWEDTYAEGVKMAFSNGPTRWSIFESKAFTEPLAGVDVEMVKEGYKYTIPDPFTPRAPQVNRILHTLIPTEVDNILRGAKTVDEAADDLCKLINEALEEQG